MRWLLIGIALLAIGVRAWGIGDGLPYIYHPDENANVSIAQTMFKTGDWNPHFFDYPSLFFYINAVAYTPFYLVGKLVGIFHSRADIQSASMLMLGVGEAPLPSVFWLGRLLTLAFGVGAVALVYMVGRQLANGKLVGPLAALIMAVSSTAVMNSRYVTPDTYLVFFILLSFWGSTLLFRQGKTWQYVLAGVAAGLAASTKYNGALIVVALIGAHFLRHGSKGFKEGKLYLALAAAASGFFATTPFALFDFQAFISAATFEGQHYSSGHVGMDGDTLNWYMAYFWSTEGIIVLLAALEVVRGIITKSKETLLVSIFPLLYFIFINSFAVRNDRTLLPMLPFVFLLGASFLAWLWRAGRQLQLTGRRWLTVMTAAVALAAVAFPMLQMAQNTNLWLQGIRVREEARQWISDNVPGGAHIAIESYTPYVDPDRFSVQAFPMLTDHTPEWYKSNHFDYLVSSEGIFGRYYHEASRYPDDVQAYDSLFNTYKAVKVFPDEKYEIRILQVGGN